MPNSDGVGMEDGGGGNCERRKEPLLMVLSAIPEAFVSREAAGMCRVRRAVMCKEWNSSNKEGSL